MSDDFVSTSRADTSKKYLLGKDGWIFLDHDSNRVIDQIRGRHVLDERGIAEWRRLIGERDRYAATLGARHLVLVAPNKELVYSEQLPDGIEISEQRPVRQIVTALGPRRGRDIIYPLEAIRTGRGHGPVYPKTDTHWSGLGAYIAYQAFCDALSDGGIEPLRLDPARVSFEEVPYIGDLGVKLEPPLSAPTLAARIKDAAGKLVFDNKIPNRGRIRVFVNENPTLPRCVMFGDSFGGNLLPFLKESFSTLVYVYGKDFDRDLIEAYQPDVILTQIVERFLIDPPAGRPHFSYASVVRSKLKLLPAEDLAHVKQQLAEIDPAIFPVRTLYEALLAAHAGQPLEPALIFELKRRHCDNPEAQHMISVELARLDEGLDEARSFAERAVKAEPWNARARHQLALTLMRLKQSDQAEVELRKAIELDPSVDWWLYQLAQVLFRQQKHQASADALQEYLARRPNSPDAWQLLGRCREALQQTEEAAGAFVRAAIAKPDWTWPLLKLANLRLNSRTKPEEGLIATDRLLEMLFQARQRAEIYILRSQLHEIQREREKAIEAAERSVELAPDWEWAGKTLARLRAQQPQPARPSFPKPAQARIGPSPTNSSWARPLPR